MDNLNIFSYLFFFMAVTAQILDFVFSSSDSYYFHYLQWVLFVVVACPIIGVILGIFGKRGTDRSIAIALNALFFIVVAPLALLNLLVLTSGK